MSNTTRTVFLLAMILGQSSFAGMVTYQSTQGTASGYAAKDPEIFFTDQPASLSIAYDSGNPTTTMRLDIFVPNIIRMVADDPYGSITWAGDTITFANTYGLGLVQPTPVTVTASFRGSLLTPGVIPQSLDGLEGIIGAFSGKANGSLLYRGTAGIVMGTAVSNPEPSTILMMALGIIGATILGARHARNNS